MDNRTTAWISYLTLIGWIVALIQHNNMRQKSSLVVFHLRQMFGLMIFYAAAWLLFRFTIFLPGFYMLRWALVVAFFVFWLIGLLGAVNGEEKPIPIIGNLFQKWFTFLK
jgi:uncharacterized membrane protein